MTAMVVAGATSSERNDPYADYLAHLATLEIGADAKRLRRNGARALLARHPNLERWMDRPIAERLVDISRAKAWPFICWAILAGRIEPDLELLIARRQGGMHVAVEAAFADSFAQLRDAASRLGWKPRWVEAVIVGPLTLAVAFTGRAPQELTDADLDTLAAGIGATMTVPADRRSRLERDIGRLRQVLYEAKVIDRPHRRRGGPVRDPLAAVAAVEIRRVIVAYLEARRPTLRPGSLAGTTNDLVCFGEFLAANAPDVTRLADLERSHIEAFCAWVPTRPWRGGKMGFPP